MRINFVGNIIDRDLYSLRERARVIRSTAAAKEVGLGRIKDYVIGEGVNLVMVASIIRLAMRVTSSRRDWMIAAVPLA
jgi:hypothetical protein